MYTNRSKPNIPLSPVQFDYRRYSRPFCVPLSTHHGPWPEREGIIIRLSDGQGRVGWGEIAPIPWFGSETLEEAIALCASFNAQSTHARSSGCIGLSVDDLRHIDTAHPASQFGLEAALDTFLSPVLSQASQSAPAEIASFPGPCCQLLPTGADALTAWQQPWSRGDRVYKWKIGVTSVDIEQTLFDQLVQALPPTAILRLDANGGLDWDTACRWLERCDGLRAATRSATSPPTVTVEFVEQPLPPESFDALLALSQRYQTPIALDESVATVTQLRQCWDLGWRGIWVLKPAIAGSPQQLRQFCQSHDLDIVWSSALETAIARDYIFRHLIPACGLGDRALGFGVDQWFAPSDLDQSDLDQHKAPLLWP